jgi:hypothetical protein
MEGAPGRTPGGWGVEKVRAKIFLFFRKAGT